jgi:hypothetical protein
MHIFLGEKRKEKEKKMVAMHRRYNNYTCHIGSKKRPTQPLTIKN